MYIQPDTPEREQQAPPDYSGHTYKAPERVELSPPDPVPEPPPDFLAQDLPPCDAPLQDADPTPTGDAPSEDGVPAGAFGGHGGTPFGKKGGKRGDFFGNLGLGGLFSRVPFLSSLAPPPRGCHEGERRHGELWDWVLLALVALSLLGGKDDDVLPLLLLLLLWD